MDDTRWDHGLRVTADGNGLVGHADAVLLRLAADRTGLTGELGPALARRGKSPQVDRGVALVSMAAAIALGATSMSDVTASLEASPWARIIKMSDFTDNAVGLFHTTGPKLTKLARKYRPLVPVLRELILRPDTPLDSSVKQMITGQLDNDEDRFAAICHDHDADSGPG